MRSPRQGKLTCCGGGGVAAVPPGLDLQKDLPVDGGWGWGWFFPREGAKDLIVVCLFYPHEGKNRSAAGRT